MSRGPRWRRRTGGSTRPAPRSRSRSIRSATRAQKAISAASISVDFDRPERSSVAFHVQAGSVDVGSASFSDYLRSAAFLDADRYPSIDFVSTSVQRVNDHMVRVSGDLTLLGVTKPLSVDVAVTRDAVGRQRLDFQAETRIDRLEFGMNSGFPLVSREVRLVISSGASEL